MPWIEPRMVDVSAASPTSNIASSSVGVPSDVEGISTSTFTGLPAELVLGVVRTDGYRARKKEANGE
jgi:hypothetical protein